MDISSDYLADLVIGTARAQNAIIEAMERANPGFRNNHALPLLTIAANMRAGDPRLIDLPSRVLLRLQGRVALDNTQVRADIERLASDTPGTAGGLADGSFAPAESADTPAASADEGENALDFSKS